jgi:hypothetical protein
VASGPVYVGNVSLARKDEHVDEKIKVKTYEALRFFCCCILLNLFDA